MGNVKKSERVQDTDIRRLNHIGLSLKAIAELLGCHPATVTLRLKAMKVAPFDTRRSFMEQVFMSLTTEQQEWLSHHLYNNDISIKDYIVSLIRDAYATANSLAASPAPMPKMKTAQTTPVEPDLLAEVEAAQATIPMVEPEFVDDDGQPNPLCSCGEAPVLTGTEECAGCLDARQNFRVDV